MEADEWILAPTTSLYFAVRRHSMSAETAAVKGRWRRGTGAHGALDEALPTLRLSSYEDVKRVVEGLMLLGTRKVKDPWLLAYVSLSLL